MKRILASVLALVIAAACCFSAAAVVEETEAPSNYLWVKTENAETPVCLGFTIPVEMLKDKTTFRIFADIMFEDVVPTADGGLAYVNIYFYDADGKLLTFADWATQNTEGVEQGKWATMDYDFSLPDGFAYATVTAGCYNATGTVNVGAINLSCNKEMIANVSFSKGVDLDADGVLPTNVSSDNQGINWDVVIPDSGETGFINVAADCPVYIFGNTNSALDGDESVAGTGIYFGRLTDGVVPEPGFIADWFGFNYNKGGMDTNTTSLDGVSGRAVGRIRIDLGEEKEFNKIRLNFWGPLDNADGVCNINLIKSYYSDSDDFSNATPFADLLFDTTADFGWADTDEKDTVSARYVFVEILFDKSCWGMISEIQVLSPELIDDDPEESSEEPSAEPSEEPSEEPSKEQSKEESKPAPTPKTGDNGMIALAVVSVITLAGVIAVKKSK